MKISGFSFVRNGVSLYYPVVESIKSILPICDEFIIAIGQGNKNDLTRKKVAAINDPKIKIIDTVWEEKYFKKGIINAIQTDIAKKACSGNWLFYLQADEVVHERYLPAIRKRCRELLNNNNIEGLLFRYKHFWGDYNHYHISHGWYTNEIRIIRNMESIHSWQSAQSFRHFDPYIQPRQETGTSKLKVATVDAEIYHYGWVRPPHLMQNKKRALDSVHWGLKRAQAFYKNEPAEFDYGPLDKLAVFKDTHPQVMHNFIKKMDWHEKLQYKGNRKKNRPPHKHERLKYKFISWLENSFKTGHLGGLKNYNLVNGI